MLIHVATDNDIHPPRFGATQRTFGLCRGMAREHEVRALCVVPNRGHGAAEERVAGVALVRRKAWYTSVAWRLDRFGWAPMFLAARGHRASAASLAHALGEDADVLMADLLLTPLFAVARARLRVYAAHNVELDHFRATHAGLGASARWNAELERLERGAVERADCVVACTQDDAARFHELYGADPARVLVIPNGWDDAAVKPADAGQRERARRALGLQEREVAVLFLGSDVEHNRRGARLIVDQLAPAARRLPPRTVRWIVAGSVGRTIRGAHDPTVTILGELDDANAVLHAADVGLNPVIAGGGSNVKVPTYLAAGLAVVTTRFGLRGYPELEPRVSVAEPDGMIEAVLAASRSPRASQPAPEVVALAWGSLGQRLARELEAVAAAPLPAEREARA